MRSIRSLSEEILDRICATLYPDELFPLALVSKQWNRIATSHMYRHPAFSTLVTFSEVEEFLRFIFSVLRDESLAANVRSFAYEGVDDSFELWKFYETMEEEAWEIEPFPWPSYISTEELDRVLSTALVKACLPTDDAEKIFQEARTGFNGDILLGVLLLNCPKLQKLELGLQKFDDTDDHLLPWDKLNLEALVPALTDIMLWGNHHRSSVYMDNFFLTVKIHSLKRLYGYKLSSGLPDELNSNTVSLQPKSSNIEFIELRCSELNKADLMSLLKAPKHLKTLIYEIGSPLSSLVFTTPGITEALEPLKEKLEELSLSHSHSIPPRDYRLSIDESGLDFRGFKKLKLLRAAPVFLFGKHLSLGSPALPKDTAEKECNGVIARGAFAQNVPSSLETLHLLCCEYVSLKQLRLAIEGLMARKEECAPNLKRLIIEEDFESCFWHFESRSGLNQHFIEITGEKGVQFFWLWDANLSVRPRYLRDRGWGINENMEWSSVLENKVGPKLRYKGFVRLLTQSCERRRFKREARKSERKMQRREEKGSQYESEEDDEAEDEDEDSYNEENFDEIDEIAKDLDELLKVAEEEDLTYQCAELYDT